MCVLCVYTYSVCESTFEYDSCSPRIRDTHCTFPHVRNGARHDDTKRLPGFLTCRRKLRQRSPYRERLLVCFPDTDGSHSRKYTETIDTIPSAYVPGRYRAKNGQPSSG